MNGKKVMSMLIVSLLVLSTGFVIYNAVDTVEAGYITEPPTGTPVKWILSNDGFGSPALNLTCGELITFRIVNNSLPYNQRYQMGVWNGTGWVPLTTPGTARSDRHGNLVIDFRVPGWKELSANPITANGTGSDESAGQWSISLFKYGSTTSVGARVFTNINITIQIGNLYFLEFWADGGKVDNLIFNKVHSNFHVRIFNWTGSNLEEAKGDATKYTFSVRMHNYTTDAGIFPLSLGTNLIAGQSTPATVHLTDTHIPSQDKEKTFWINVSDANNIGASYIPLHVLYDVTMTSPSSSPTAGPTWGDTFRVEGSVNDGTGVRPTHALGVYVYQPRDGGHVLASMTNTPAMGTNNPGDYLTTNIETGSGKGFSAGTWYVGTYATGTGRPDMSHQPPYMPGFIPYETFTLRTKDIATVSIVTTDDITTGFPSTVNISVRNETWMTGSNKEYQNMNIHIRGVDVKIGATIYKAGDRVLVNSGTPSRIDDRSTGRAWYEFDVTFLSTGPVTVEVSHPGNLHSIQNWNTTSVVGDQGNYSAKFRNEDLRANITGSTSFSVISPAAMNMRIPELVTDDLTVQITGACSTGKRNVSGLSYTINVYGNEITKPMNASITVKGCGLDFTIHESRTEAGTGKGSPYLVEYNYDTDTNGSWYEVLLAPKTGGTLTITATNGTTGRSVSRDFPVKGLTGAVTTSVGDDLEITVGTTETITVTGVSEFAMIYVTYFDENWECIGVLNVTDPLEPTNRFTPDIKIADWAVGYIVVVATMGDQFDQHMYEIIEVVPIDDLTVDVITPDAANNTLTVGMYNDLVVKLRDADGNLVEDNSPGFTVKLIDDNSDWDDPLQEWTFSGNEIDDRIHPYFSGQLIIQGHNDSAGIKHIGRAILDVDYATITYSPSGATAGIGLEDVKVEVIGVDANNNPLADLTLYLWAEDDSGGLLFDSQVNLDAEGIGEFDIDVVGNRSTYINATLQSGNASIGNRTLGRFNIDFPTFILAPDTIYIGQANVVEVTALDVHGVALDDINLTFMRDGLYIEGITPAPVRTDANGHAVFSLTPSASGEFNVTIIKAVLWKATGELDWVAMNADKVVTDTVLVATAFKLMDVSAPATVNEGASFSVTVTSRGTTVPISGARVTFNAETQTTGTDGKATFTAPQVTGDRTFTIRVAATGYIDAQESIMVINVPALIITVTPSPGTDGKYASPITVTVSSDTGSLITGVTVTFDGQSYTTVNGQVEISVTAETTDVITAAFTGFTSATFGPITVKPTGIPGFELVVFIAALGAALILLKRRQK